MKEKILQSAIDYLGRSWSIIPVSKSKKPFFEWKKYQTERPTIGEVYDWSQKYGEDFNLAVVTGAISGITVVDIELNGSTAGLPETLMAKSGGGGTHFYYKYKPGVQNKARIRELMDIRGDGGYIILPPSESEKGKYEWLNDKELVDFPEDIFKLAEKKESIFRPVNGYQVSGEIPEYDGTSEGARNDSMTRYIGKILPSIHPADWESIGWFAVMNANQKNFPPLGERELRTIFDSIKNREKVNPSPRKAYPIIEPIIVSNEDEVKPMFEVAAFQSQKERKFFSTGMNFFDDSMRGGFKEGDLVVITGKTGEGKCFAKGTKVLMYNGLIKNIEDISVGEFIMGDDSTKRIVLGLGTGKEKMYRVLPVKGDSYIVNESHILSLKKTGFANFRYDNPKKEKRNRKKYKGEIVDIELKEYLNKSIGFKHRHKTYRVGVEWRKKGLKIEPYFLGLWLGDGTSSQTGITTMDKEIVEYLYLYAKKINHKITVKVQPNNKSKIYSIVRPLIFKPVNKRNNIGFGKTISLVSLLKKINVLNNKHIPIQYKINSRDNRLELLAGLIDSDGYVNSQGYTFVNKNEILINDVLFLCRSLGLAAYKKKFYNKRFNLYYFKVGISGDCSVIPVRLKRKLVNKRRQKKDVLVTGIRIEELGIDNYYGVELNGNGKFLLGDFTVVHNTSWAQTLTYYLSKQGIATMFMSYEVLIEYIWQKFKDMGMDNESVVYSPLKMTSGGLDWIEKKSMEAIEKYGVKCVVIDHLGFLLPPKQKYDNQINSNYAAYLGGICRDLKLLALKNELIIILLAHTRKTEKPTINDLKDSSGIAQEADYVFIVERILDKSGSNDKMNYVGDGIEKQNLFTDKATITLAKNRSTGQTFSKKFIMKNELLMPE